VAEQQTDRKPKRRWRRYLALVVALLIAPCLPWPLPRAELEGQREALAPPRGAPEVWIPRADLEGGNELRAIFVHELPDGGRELTLWFRDEDHPWAPIDNAYDLYRWLRWRRVDDLETVILTPARDLALPGTAARAQPFDVLWAKHHTALIGRGGGDRLYVRTWNHLFSNEPQEGLDYVQVKVQFLRGSRAELEAEVQAAWPR
jgi:hypothetical protein